MYRWRCVSLVTYRRLGNLLSSRAARVRRMYKRPTDHSLFASNGLPGRAYLRCSHRHRRFFPPTPSPPPSPAACRRQGNRHRYAHPAPGAKILRISAATRASRRPERAYSKEQPPCTLLQVLYFVDERTGCATFTWACGHVDSRCGSDSEITGGRACSAEVRSRRTVIQE